MEDIDRTSFFRMIGRRPIEEIEAIQDAYWMAKDGHRRQRRDDGERYFEHPRRVAAILIHIGRQDTALIVTALLHDLVEDTLRTPSHHHRTLRRRDLA